MLFLACLEIFTGRSPLASRSEKLVHVHAFVGIEPFNENSRLLVDISKQTSHVFETIHHRILDKANSST